MTASGTAGHGAELGAYVDLAALGAVVVKSCRPSPGPATPRPACYPAVGGHAQQGRPPQRRASAPGSTTSCPALRRAGARVVASIWGSHGRGVRGAAAAMLADAGPEVVAVEVNLSCPNLEAGRHMFAHSPARDRRRRRRPPPPCGRPLWAKLSPNVTDLTAIAAAALDSRRRGAHPRQHPDGSGDRPGTGPARLGAGGGGLSGPAIHPVAVRAVYECRAAFPDAGIVGVGGVGPGGRRRRVAGSRRRRRPGGHRDLRRPAGPARVLAEVRTLVRHAAALRRVADLIGAAHA